MTSSIAMRILSEPSLSPDSIIVASTNQTVIVPSSSPSSSASSFSPNSDPGMPTTAFHPPPHNNNSHNHRPSSQPPPVIHQQQQPQPQPPPQSQPQQPNQNAANAGGGGGGGGSDLKATDNDNNTTNKFYIRGERSQPAYPHPAPPPISLLANNQGYIPFASEFYTTEQGYFMPQELCAAHAPICLHSDYGKICVQTCVRFYSQNPPWNRLEIHIIYIYRTILESPSCYLARLINSD